MSAASSERAEITRALLRFNAHVLAVIVGLLSAVGLFLATVIMAAQGNTNPEGLLALLRHFLPGYRISLPGAFVGALWAATIGYGLGGLLGFGYGPWVLREAVRAGADSESERPGQRIALLRPLPVALTTGCVSAAGLFLATNWLWFRYGVPSPNLELLRYYLPGYTSDFQGSLIGAVWMFVYGALGAAIVAWIYDRVVAIRFP